MPVEWENRPFQSSPAATPIAGFVVKITSSGLRHYINLCSHPSLGRPIDAKDREVSDAHLQARGIDNLRVPLLTGTARTHLLPNGEGEAICIDVVFCTTVINIALTMPPEGGSEEENCPHPSEHAVQLGKFVRLRLIELALCNVEEELGYKLGRNFTLPRGATYKGGVRGSKVPAPMPALRQLTEALAAEERMMDKKESAGPWRSKRMEAGLGAGRPAPRIEELELPSEHISKAPLVRKGFLTGGGTNGLLYPNGSTEGTPPEGAGDPLGWMPKGLRSRVKVVDTASTPPEAQQEAILRHANAPFAANIQHRVPETPRLQVAPDAQRIEREPAFELSDFAIADATCTTSKPGLQLLVRLPLLDSFEEADVDISNTRLKLVVSGKYKLEFLWPHAVASEEAKAKFVKKNRSLKVTVPRM